MCHTAVWKSTKLKPVKDPERPLLPDCRNVENVVISRVKRYWKRGFPTFPTHVPILPEEDLGKLPWHSDSVLSPLGTDSWILRSSSQQDCGNNITTSQPQITYQSTLMELKVFFVKKQLCRVETEDHRRMFFVMFCNGQKRKHHLSRAYRFISSHGQILIAFPCLDAPERAEWAHCVQDENLKKCAEITLLSLLRYSFGTFWYLIMMKKNEKP